MGTRNYKLKLFNRDHQLVHEEIVPGLRKCVIAGMNNEHGAKYFACIPEPSQGHFYAAWRATGLFTEVTKNRFRSVLGKESTEFNSTS